jgi:hypothetical protein
VQEGKRKSKKLNHFKDGKNGENETNFNHFEHFKYFKDSVFKSKDKTKHNADVKQSEKSHSKEGSYSSSRDSNNTGKNKKCIIKIQQHV